MKFLVSRVLGVIPKDIQNKEELYKKFKDDSLPELSASPLAEHTDMVTKVSKTAVAATASVVAFVQKLT